MENPGPIEGVLHDEWGAPIVGARAYFTNGPTPFPDVAALTGADGRFSLPAPRPGTYEITCSADGLGSTSVLVEAPSDVALDIRFPPPG